jgi:hypothetical protein|tara:strand:+ start:284 stop:592 length:309 start_codon:yes stop_codon:yes gene_type:complete
VKYFNKGIAAHLEAMLELLDDDHLIFNNTFGLGPIDIVTVNIKSGEVTFYDAKSDRERSHKKRELTELQKKLGVKNFYVNLHNRTWRLESRLGKLPTKGTKL